MSPCMRKYGSSGDAYTCIRHAYRYSRICIRQHHGARIWPRAGHSRPRPAHGTHRRPSLARRPTRLGRAPVGRRARPAPSPTWWRWSLPPRRRVLSGRRGGWWCSTRAHARYSRAPRAYFGWAGDRPRSSRSLLRMQTWHCVGSDAWDDASSTSGHAALPYPLSPPPLPPSPLDRT